MLFIAKIPRIPRPSNDFNRFRKFSPLPIALAASTFLSGCALVNPYVNIDSDIDKLQSANEVCGLDARPGIRRACLYRAEYLHRLGLDASYRNILGLTLIPIGATALGLGIDGGNSTAITILGLSGSAMYASGQVLTSRPRETVLLQGLKALTCAMTASYSMTLDDQSQRILGVINLPGDPTPMALAGSVGPQRTSLDQKKKAYDQPVIALLAEALGKLKAANLTLRIELAALPADNPTKLVLESYANQIDVLAESAKTVGERATAIRNWLNARDIRLGLVAGRINDQVNENIGRTIIDLQGIMTVVGGLMPNAAMIAPQPKIDTPTVPSAKGDGGSTEGPQDLNRGGAVTAAKEMQADLADVLTYVQQLQNVVSLLAGSELPVDIKGCDFKVPEETFQLQLLPNTDLSIPEKTAWNGALSVEGGSPPFDPKVIGSTSEAITVTATLRSVVINVAADAKPGSYSILVRDKAGQNAVKKLTITATPKTEPPPGKTGSATTEMLHVPKDLPKGLNLCTETATDAQFSDKGKFILYGAEKALVADTTARKTIQEAIGLTGAALDSKFGRSTREKICAWQEQNAPDKKNGVLTEEQIGALSTPKNDDPFAKPEGGSDAGS